MELKGFLKNVVKHEGWTEITTFVAAARLMDLEVGQKYPIFMNNEQKDAEIIRINGELITFKTLNIE